MKLFFIVSSLFCVLSCAAQSQLPKEMPEKVIISLNNGGGMTRSYKKIRIENGILEFAELAGNRETPEKWSAKITGEDLAKLYKVFVENKFDMIKNGERRGIVYDAGSENISISVNITKSFQVTYGKNSPLSGKNLERYQAISRAIYDLVSRYQDRKTNDLSTDNRTMSETEKYIQGKWRAAGQFDRHAWFLEWTFDNGRFKQTGYPAIFQEGKYKVVSLADDKITIELYEQKGTFGENNRKVEIVIDKEIQQLSISNTTGFRVSPQ